LYDPLYEEDPPDFKVIFRGEQAREGQRDVPASAVFSNAQVPYFGGTGS
jgi:hypothetical protein